MLVVTTDDLPGYEVRQVLGEVLGATSRLRNPFFDKVRTLPRGDLHPKRTRYLVRWRKEVIEEMVKAARERGANAVVGMRFDHREISDVWGEMCAYGTAVYAVPVEGRPPHAATAHAASARPRPARGQAATP